MTRADQPLVARPSEAANAGDARPPLSESEPGHRAELPVTPEEDQDLPDVYGRFESAKPSGTTDRAASAGNRPNTAPGDRSHVSVLNSCAATLAQSAPHRWRLRGRRKEERRQRSTAQEASSLLPAGCS